MFVARVLCISFRVLFRALHVVLDMYIAMLIFFVFSFLPSLAVRREVGADVRHLVFTVAILAQGTNRGDALCAALLSNRVVSILGESIFSHFVLVVKIKLKFALFLSS